MAEYTDAEMLRCWVWLSMVFGAGSSKVWQYLRKYETPDAVCDALLHGHVYDVPDSAKKLMAKHSLTEADSIVYYCRNHGIALLTPDDPDYPGVLRTIGTPPFLLTAQGNLELLKNPLALSVVGTRHPSPYTERVMHAILGNLLTSKFVIVSGFAKGVDAIAHTCALDAGCGTIAVLGCGINVNYPRENAELRSRMLASGNGLFLSEYLPGTQPFPANFPKRNRILSGLGYVTAVMEGAKRSGSMVTAEYANEQGRFLMAVPPDDLFDERYSGQAGLLRDGAVPLMSHRDILMMYYGHFPQYLTVAKDEIRPSQRLVFAGAPAVLNDAEPDTLTDAPPKPETPLPKPVSAAKLPEPAKRPAPVPEPVQPLPEDEDSAKIVSYLRAHGAVYADDLASALDMDLSLLLGTLTLLELDGYVESLFGKQYRAL